MMDVDLREGLRAFAHSKRITRHSREEHFTRLLAAYPERQHSIRLWHTAHFLGVHYYCAVSSFTALASKLDAPAECIPPSIDDGRTTRQRTTTDKRIALAVHRCHQHVPNFWYRLHKRGVYLPVEPTANFVELLVTIFKHCALDTFAVAAAARIATLLPPAKGKQREFGPDGRRTLQLKDLQMIDSLRKVGRIATRTEFDAVEELSYVEVDARDPRISTDVDGVRYLESERPRKRQRVQGPQGAAIELPSTRCSLPRSHSPVQQSRHVSAARELPETTQLHEPGLPSDFTDSAVSGLDTASDSDHSSALLQLASLSSSQPHLSQPLPTTPQPMFWHSIPMTDLDALPPHIRSAALSYHSSYLTLTTWLTTQAAVLTTAKQRLTTSRTTLSHLETQQTALLETGTALDHLIAQKSHAITLAKTLQQKMQDIAPIWTQYMKIVQPVPGATTLFDIPMLEENSREVEALEKLRGDLEATRQEVQDQEMRVRELERGVGIGKGVLGLGKGDKEWIEDG